MLGTPHRVRAGPSPGGCRLAPASSAWRPLTTWRRGEFGDGHWTLQGQVAVKGGSREGRSQFPRQPGQKEEQEIRAVCLFSGRGMSTMGLCVFSAGRNPTAPNEFMCQPESRRRAVGLSGGRGGSGQRAVGPHHTWVSVRAEMWDKTSHRQEPQQREVNGALQEPGQRAPGSGHPAGRQDSLPTLVGSVTGPLPPGHGPTSQVP